MALERAQLVKHLRDLQYIKLDGIRMRIIDAKGMVVGKLASDIATMLQGKDKPTFTPKQNMGDMVIVINAAHVHLTHDKWDTKLYRWHTGWPGGLKEKTASEMWHKDPARIIINAVKGMLPKNRQRIYRLDKLKVFPEAEHPYTGFPLVPYVPKPTPPQVPGIGWPMPPSFEPMNREKYGFRVFASPHMRQAGGREAAAQAAQAGLKGFEQLLTAQEREALQASLAAEQKGGSGGGGAVAVAKAAGGAGKDKAGSKQ